MLLFPAQSKRENKNEKHVLESLIKVVADSLHDETSYDTSVVATLDKLSSTRAIVSIHTPLNIPINDDIPPSLREYTVSSTVPPPPPTSIRRTGDDNTHTLIITVAFVALERVPMPKRTFTFHTQLWILSDIRTKEEAI
jgi:hypothetical protein